METLAQVHEVEDILLEATSSETDTGFEEFRPDTRVEPNGVGDFVDVSAGGFADGGEGIDGRDTLGEHGVGGEFGELGGPETDI